MKHLLNNDSEIILSTHLDYKYEAGKKYGEGDPIPAVERVNNIKWHINQLDHFGNPTGLKIEVNIAPSEINQIYFKMQEIQDAEPTIVQYSNLPF